MSLQVWLKPEGDSLDPPKLSSKAKVEKLVKALIKEREHVLKDLRKEIENIGSSTLHTLKQIEFAVEDGNNPLWGSFGPMQGTAQFLERSTSIAGRFHTINEVLDAIYTMFPEFKPTKKERPKKPEPKPSSGQPEGRKKKGKK